MSFYVYLEEKIAELRAAGYDVERAEYLFECISHPLYPRSAAARPQIIQHVADITPYAPRRGTLHPQAILPDLLPGYLTWREAERARARLQREAERAADKAIKNAKRLEREAEARALAEARSQSRALRDRERALRIARLEQKMGVAAAAPQAEAPQEPKRPSPFDP